MLNFVEIEKLVRLQDVMCNYNKTQVSPYDPAKPAIHSFMRPEDDHISNCGQKFKKTVPFDDMVHFIDEESIVTFVDFDCGCTSYPEPPTKHIQINLQHNYISRSCEKPKCLPNNHQPNYSIVEQHSSKIFLDPYILWDIVPATIMSLSHTNDRYCMTISTLNHQFSNLERTHIRCALQCEQGTVKARDSASVLHPFNEIKYRTDEWTKQLLRLKNWEFSGNLEQWMEFRRLRWTVILFKCNSLFQLLDYCCLLVQYLLFIWKSIFCSLSSMTVSKKQTPSTTSM